MVPARRHARHAGRVTKSPDRAIRASVAVIFIFPVAGIFGTWLWGAWLTWTAAWFELVGMIVWTSAASSRPELPSVVAVTSRA